MSSDNEKNCSKRFSDASNSSDIEEEVIKQINMLKPFNINVIRKKYFVSQEENNCEGEIDLISQNRIGNID